METTVNYVLPVPLSEEELRLAASALAQKLYERERVQIEKSAAMQAFKGQLDDLEDEIAALAKAVREGKEDRAVKCRWRPAAGAKMELVRADDGEVIQVRGATPEELQGDFFPAGPRAVRTEGGQ